MRIPVVLVVALAVAACGSAEKRRVEGQQALDDAHTLLDLTQLVGVPPKSCQPLSDTTKMCFWAVNNRRPGYKKLAGIIDTDAVVYLNCELPNDNSPRKPDSCKVSAAR